MWISGHSLLRERYATSKTSANRKLESQVTTLCLWLSTTASTTTLTFTKSTARMQVWKSYTTFTSLSIEMAKYLSSLQWHIMTMHGDGAASLAFSETLRAPVQSLSVTSARQALIQNTWSRWMTNLRQGMAPTGDFTRQIAKITMVLGTGTSYTSNQRKTSWSYSLNIKISKWGLMRKLVTASKFKVLQWPMIGRMLTSVWSTEIQTSSICLIQPENLSKKFRLSRDQRALTLTGPAESRTSSLVMRAIWLGFPKQNVALRSVALVVTTISAVSTWCFRQTPSPKSPIKTTVKAKTQKVMNFSL